MTNIDKGTKTTLRLHDDMLEWLDTKKIQVGWRWGLMKKEKETIAQVIERLLTEIKKSEV